MGSGGSSLSHQKPFPTFDVIAFDFDKTLTFEDTTPILASMTESPDAWIPAQQEYLDRYQTVTEELERMSNISMVVDAYAVFEEREMWPVLEQGLLRGIRQEELLRSAPHEVRVRPGVREVLEGAEKYGVDFQVVSSNWSGELIASTLELPTSRITANWLEFDYAYGGDGISTGRFRSQEITTGKDKGDWVSLSSSPSQSGRRSLLYVGDGMNDVDALRKADVGVTFGAAERVRAVFERCGFTVRQVTDGYEPAVGDVGIVYAADSWRDIHRLVLQNTFP